MKKFKIYLAGKMAGLTYKQMNNWREEVDKKLKERSEGRIITVNPVKFYNFLMNQSTFTQKEVKKFDLHQVKTSDLVLVNFEYPDSIGTAIELFVSANIYQIPVIGFNPNPNIHPWMLEDTDKMCNTLDDAVDYIMDYYLINHKF